MVYHKILFRRGEEGSLVNGIFNIWRILTVAEWGINIWIVGGLGFCMKSGKKWISKIK